MADALQVLTVGESMVLVTPERAEPLESATAFRLDVAGAESNVASHLARAGVPVAWASAVGDDALGRRLLATLSSRGVDTSLVLVDPSAPTGVFFKDPGSAGTQVLYYRQGSAASRLGPSYAAKLPLASVPLVHLSGITAALSSSCAALLDHVLSVRADAELPVSFDVNYRPALWPVSVAGPALLSLARRCDVVFVGLDEASTLWGTPSPADVRTLVDVPHLVVKDGPVAAHAFTRSSSWSAPVQPVNVVEPVGAGDAFAAGYLAASLAGASPEAALASGHRFAAAVLATTGDF